MKITPTDHLRQEIHKKKQTSRCQNKSHSTFGWRVSLSQPPSQKPLYSWRILERTETTAVLKQAKRLSDNATGYFKTLHWANCKGSQKLEIFAVGESSESVLILGHPFQCQVTESLDATKPFFAAHNSYMQNWNARKNDHESEWNHLVATARLKVGDHVRMCRSCLGDRLFTSGKTYGHAIFVVVF